ncbi:MAG: hypothetical protein EBR59_10820, partial [Methylococcaceae bacterium]|nr:hypothetical protein [Methylococcaceae bacterium]
MTVINASNWAKYEAGDELVFGIGEKDSLAPFVHVAVNKESDHITATRDHFGQEPFYYSYQNRRFVFGSTIPDIIKHLPSHPKPNMARIARDLLPWTGIDWPPYSNETYYEGIFRVEPGHTLTIRGDDVQ